MTEFWTAKAAQHVTRCVIQRPLVAVVAISFVAFFAVFDGWDPATDRVDEYNSRLPSREEADAINAMSLEVDEVTERYRMTRGFFWGCDEKCVPERDLHAQLSSHLGGLLKQQHDRIRHAKSALGPFSKTAFADVLESARKNLGELSTFVRCSVVESFARVVTAPSLRSTAVRLRSVCWRAVRGDRTF